VTGSYGFFVEKTPSIEELSHLLPLHHPVDRDHQCIDHFIVALPDPFDHTTLHMTFQKDPTDTVQSRLNSGDLSQHIIAVRIVLNQTAHSPDLTLDPIQPGGEIALHPVGMVAFPRFMGLTYFPILTFQGIQVRIDNHHGLHPFPLPYYTLQRTL
jgi:hypothetical protein